MNAKAGRLRGATRDGARAPGRRRAAAGLVLLVVTAGPACASPVTVQPAPSATDPACARVLVRLPESAAGLQRREVSSQSAAAWSRADDLPAVVLRCGVEPPGPTTDPCTSVEGVDWVVDDSAGSVRYRTYGRSPAVELLVPEDSQDGVDAVLAAVSTAVRPVPAERSCL